MLRASGITPPVTRSVQRSSIAHFVVYTKNVSAEIIVIYGDAICNDVRIIRSQQDTVCPTGYYVVLNGDVTNISVEATGCIVLFKANTSPQVVSNHIVFYYQTVDAPAVINGDALTPI